MKRLIAAFIVLMSSAALADVVGVPPLQNGDFSTINQTWLNGLAGGQNQRIQDHLTAFVGGGQAGATRLIPGRAMYQVDIVANNGDSIQLPPCKPPMQIIINNNGANSLNLFAANNSSDFINGVAGSTAVSISSDSAALFVCIESGQWATISGKGGGGSGCGSTNLILNYGLGCTLLTQMTGN